MNYFDASVAEGRWLPVVLFPFQNNGVLEGQGNIS
jgi:hypothetical protein